jgi:serine/threonine protein kinase
LAPNGASQKNGGAPVDLSGCVGTPIYFSPEQNAQYNGNKGEVVELDSKIDIYALGLILLELALNITTSHEKMTSFNDVKVLRRIPSS